MLGILRDTTPQEELTKEFLILYNLAISRKKSLLELEIFLKIDFKQSMLFGIYSFMILIWWLSYLA